LPEAGG